MIVGKLVYWRVRFEFKLADMWIGAYWSRDHQVGYCVSHVYICFVPCVPLHISWTNQEYEDPYPDVQSM